MPRKTDELATRLVRRTRAAKLDRALLSHYTQAKLPTVDSWLREKHPLRGMHLNRLQHLLATLEIDSPELDEVTPFGRYLGRLLAFDLITLDQAQAYLGTGHSQAVFESIRGERDPFDVDNVNQPTVTLEYLENEYNIRLITAEDEMRRRFADASANAGTEVNEDVGLEQVSKVPATRDLLIVHIASTASSLMPLLRWLLEDATPEERHYFRTLMGDEGTFDMSNMLVQLCSERARDYQGR